MKLWVLGGSKGGPPEEVEITHVGTDHRWWHLGQTAFESEAHARAVYAQSFLDEAKELETKAAEHLARAAALRGKATEWA